MRYCDICGKPMHTSINGFWLKKKRYDAHTTCERKTIEDALQKAIEKNENNNKN